MRRLISVLAVAAAFLLTATGAVAAGAGAVSYTQTDHNATAVLDQPNPCTGAAGTFTLTYNDVFHITTLDNGTFWGTYTQTGTFAFAPDDASQPSYTGRFAFWDGENGNLRNATETLTFTLRGVGSDGSTLAFHETAHMSVSATGVTISFDKLACR